MRWLPNTWGDDCLTAGDEGEPSIGEFDDGQLLAWAAGLAYEITSAIYDATGVIETGVLRWPDGSAGSYTRTVKNTGCNAVDAYVLTHTVSGATVTQTTVTRDGFCNVTVKPVLVVSGYVPAASSIPSLENGQIVNMPTVASVVAAIVTAEFISLAADINGDAGVFVRDTSSSETHDGVMVLVDNNGTRFIRRSHA